MFYLLIELYLKEKGVVIELHVNGSIHLICQGFI